jgi:hypothetical protein
VTEDVYQSRAKLAARLAFVAAGFGVACWAPLVPFAKTRRHLGDDTMGLALFGRRFHCGDAARGESERALQ